MSILAPNCQNFYRFSHPKDQFPQKWSNGWCLFLVKNSGFGLKDQKNCRNLKKREIMVHAAWPDLSRPTSVELESIKDCDQLDQILQQAKDNSQPVIIDWMANWCRKCIYLKPKLEKMAADYDTKVKFYYVDVNNVPQALVKRKYFKNAHNPAMARRRNESRSNWWA